MIWLRSLRLWLLYITNQTVSFFMPGISVKYFVFESEISAGQLLNHRIRKVAPNSSVILQPNSRTEILIMGILGWKPIFVPESFSITEETKITLSSDNIFRTKTGNQIIEYYTTSKLISISLKRIYSYLFKNTHWQISFASHIFIALFFLIPSYFVWDTKLPLSKAKEQESLSASEQVIWQNWEQSFNGRSFFTPMDAQRIARQKKILANIDFSNVVSNKPEKNISIKVANDSNKDAVVSDLKNNINIDKLEDAYASMHKAARQKIDTVASKIKTDTQSRLDSIFMENRGKFRNCYEQVLLQNQQYQTALSLIVTVSASGRLAKPQVNFHKKLFVGENLKMKSCLQQAAKQIRVPKEYSGIQLRRDFVFKM